MKQENNSMRTMDLSNDNFGCVVNSAVRYCLGRRTYMPKVVCDYLTPLLPYLSERTLGCMERDIREAPSWGDECDVETWSEFLGRVRQTMGRRAIKQWS